MTYCWMPGEPVVAVGPANVVETVNTVAAVYDKATGALQTTLDFESFWDGSGTTTCLDPRALYIASANRFAISCTDNTRGGNGPVRFAISRTSDPTGPWHRYALANTSFLDQDKIVATSDKFVVAGNGSTNEEIYVYNLSDVVSGLPSPTVSHLVAAKANLYQAAVEQTATSPAYLVFSYPGAKLWLASVTGTPAAGNVAIHETSISSSDFPAPQEPVVPGGSIGGGDLDGRVYDAVYEVDTSDNHPVIQYSSARECGVRTCVTSARIDLSGAKPKLVSNTLVGEPGWDYTYGAVGMDGAGHVFEAYSRSSPSSPPAAALVGPGFDVTLQQPTGGTTSCANGQTSPCDERWGDYLGVAVDPNDATKVWVTGLYQQASGGYAWGSVIQAVSLTSFHLPSLFAARAAGVTGTGAQVKVTVDPNGAATTFHLDYGLTSGYDSATAETTVGSGSVAVTRTVTLTGLMPGTTYHYRVVATTSVGRATSRDRTLTTSPRMITSAAFSGSAGAPTVTINGTDLGSPPVSQPAGCSTSGSEYGANGLWLEDASRGWTAGQDGDCIGLVIESWTPTSISFKFGSGYTVYGTLADGDSYTLEVLGARAAGTVSGLH